MVACGTVDGAAGRGPRAPLDRRARGARPTGRPACRACGSLQTDGSRRLFELDPGVDDQALLQAALATGPVREFERVEPSLGEIFRTVIEEAAA